MGTKRLVAALAIVGGVLALAPAAQAAAPRHVTVYANVSVTDDYFTDLCGFEVVFFNVGPFKATLFPGADGTVVREVDTYPNVKTGWFAPDSGSTVRFPVSATLITDYPNGTAPGAAVTVTIDGFAGKVPGIPADAGRVVFAGHVLFIDPSGAPIVAFDDLISLTGRSSAPATFEAALCAALS